jgi:L-glyceraldehyde 3-phosphate reductase
VQRDRLSWHQFTAESTRYDRMEFRRCGNSGLKLPAISLGTWETFGGYRGAEITRECIFRAFNLGVTHFDLANNYGTPPGRAETFLGRVLREMPRAELIVSTKAGFPMWPGPCGHGGSRKHLLSSIDQSLQRLGLDYLDIFYSHRPDAETPLSETIAVLDQIVRQGKALYVGLSNYSRSSLKEAVRIMHASKGVPILVQQGGYNLFQRDAELDLLTSAHETGVGFIACSPLLEGLLTTKYLDGFPEESRGAKVWTDKQRAAITTTLKQKIRKLNEIAQARGQTLPQMAIAWVLRRPEVTSAVIGASAVEQIEENVQAIDNVKFSEEELRRIDEITVE